jgi:hypothetical protein
MFDRTWQVSWLIIKIMQKSCTGVGLRSGVTVTKTTREAEESSTAHISDIHQPLTSRGFKVYTIFHLCPVLLTDISDFMFPLF